LIVERGNTVKINYTVKTNGNVIDSSIDRDPMEFKVGEGDVIRGLDEAVVGLEKGEKKKLKIPPEKAYGKREESLVGKMPREKFGTIPPEEVREGTIVQLKTQKGETLSATIVQVEKDNVTVDLNHPLAGQTIEFELEIVDIKQ
jgi:FKBP-type peptidyl-prolyl cis-trans isomerase 2